MDTRWGFKVLDKMEMIDEHLLQVSNIFPRINVYFIQICMAMESSAHLVTI